MMWACVLCTWTLMLTWRQWPLSQVHFNEKICHKLSLVSKIGWSETTVIIVCIQMMEIKTEIPFINIRLRNTFSDVLMDF